MQLIQATWSIVDSIETIKFSESDRLLRYSTLRKRVSQLVVYGVVEANLVLYTTTIYDLSQLPTSLPSECGTIRVWCAVGYGRRHPVPAGFTLDLGYQMFISSIFQN